MSEVEQRNRDIEQRLAFLHGLLSTALDARWGLDLDRLKRAPELPTLDAGGLDRPERVPSLAEFTTAPAPLARLVRRLLPGGEERERIIREAALREYTSALEARADRERHRLAELGRRRERHEAECRRITAEVGEHNAGIDRIKTLMASLLTCQGPRTSSTRPSAANSASSGNCRRSSAFRGPRGTGT
jgi:hypothetical protein